MKTLVRSKRVYGLLFAIIVLSLIGACSKKQFSLKPSYAQPISASVEKGLTGEKAGLGGNVQEEILTESGAFSGGVRAKSGSVDDSFGPGFRGPGSDDLKVASMLPFQSTSNLEDIHFKFDEYGLDRVAKNILGKNAQWLKLHPKVKLEIQGHCDERGTNNYNLALGDRRAISVKKFLIALGVEKKRMITTSFGEEQPSCMVSNENCWWQNRRGHFRIAG